MSNSPFGNFAPSCGWSGGNPNNQCLSRNAEKREGKENWKFLQAILSREARPQGGKDRTYKQRLLSSFVEMRESEEQSQAERPEEQKQRIFFFLIEGQNHNSTTYQISVQEGTCPQRMRESRAKILDCLIHFTFFKTQTMLIWNEMS